MRLGTYTNPLIPTVSGCVHSSAILSLDQPEEISGAFNIWEKREDGTRNGQSFEKFAGGFSDTAR